MDAILGKVLSVTIIIFMVSSLLEVGLKLKVDEAWRALHNGRFLVLSLLWAYVLCPALAVLLTKIIPLSKPYAVGMLFLGMAPCAPFFPVAVQKARGDLAYVAALTLLASVGTVICMPLLTPVLVPGFTAGAWTIAKPLVFFIMAPLAIGIAIRRAGSAFAEKSHPILKKVTVIDMIIMSGLLLWIYRTDIVGMIGTYAIGTQFLYYLVVAAASYELSFGLPHSQKSVLTLGVCTRNVGAAIAPLFTIAGADKRAIVMAVMAAPITMVCAFGAAPLLARFAPAGESAAA